MKIGIICGHQMPDLMKNPEKIRIDTKYGEVIMYANTLGVHEVFLIHRHGEQFNLPPHNINYRGNIQAFVSSHVSSVFSIGTVGSMKKTIHPNDLVIPHDFIDVTKSRVQTFFDDKRVYADMTEPFCSNLRDALKKSCENTQDVTYHEKGVYLVTEGPRLETAAEITLYSMVADVVGMTIAPEIVLAREKGICFASVCLVCNMAAGLQDRLTADEITTVYKKREPVLSKIVCQAIQSLDENHPCRCPSDITQVSV